ncbi:MAG: glycosyltransferase family 39 protein [Caldilineaceae bacterium]
MYRPFEQKPPQKLPERLVVAMQHATDHPIQFGGWLAHLKPVRIVPLLPHRRLILIFMLALLANLIILSPAALLLKTIAALVLTGLLPGALLVEWVVGRSDAPPPWWEQGLYTIGAGYGTMVFPMLALSYWPGGITREQALLTFDGILLLLLALNYQQPSRPIKIDPKCKATFQQTTQPVRAPIFKQHWLLIGILSLALIGGFLRFTHLGYAEFQGDEARVTLYSANVVQGYENALFIHRKGPAEILIPTVLYALTERLTETTARLPFALANFTALFVVFVLGWRLFGPVAGWSAAMLLALDGYLIAFARIVQYQSIVFLILVLAVLIGHRLLREPKALTRYFSLAAFVLATGLLAHYEAALGAIPLLYLLWRLWRRAVPWRQLLRKLTLPVLLGAVLLAGFYAPFVLKPSFNETYGYLVGHRLGAGNIYNNLVDFFNRTTVYSSSYYVLTLIGLTVIGLLQRFAGSLTGGWRWLAGGLVLAGLALTFWSPTWLKIGKQDGVWLFFVTLFVTVCLLPHLPQEERLVWLWFGAPLLFNLFFTAIPNTHVYTAFMGWALFAGLVLERGWQTLVNHWSARTAVWLAAPVALGATLLFGAYEYWCFVYHGVEVLRTWPVNRPKGYWVPYTMPTNVAIFGFPLNTGWKVVGDLYANGVLKGNYDTNVTETVATWYTRGANACGRDAPYYVLANRVEPGRAASTQKLREQLQSDHELWGTVVVNGQPGLEIYKLGKTRSAPRQFPLEPYAEHFDQTLAGPTLHQDGPVSQATIQHTLNLRLGNAIWLKGYTLDKTTARPGEAVPLTLYWQATQPVDTNYSVFVQIIDLKDFHRAGQQDGQPGCAANPTKSWLPGDVIADHYSIPIGAEARTGEYSLITGMYVDDVRLPVHTAAGQARGNQIELSKLEVDEGKEDS